MYAARNGSSTRRSHVAVGHGDHFVVSASVLKPLTTPRGEARSVIDSFIQSDSATLKMSVLLIGFAVPLHPGRGEPVIVHFGLRCDDEADTSWTLASTPLTKAARNIFLGAGSDKLPVPSSMSDAQ